MKKDENKKINIVNLTPHVVCVRLADGQINEYLSEGVLRVSSVTKIIDTLEDSTPLTYTKFGDLLDPPQESEGIIYIVSSIVCFVYKDRSDFYIPNQIVRNNGMIIGCRSLKQNPYCEI